MPACPKRLKTAIKLYEQNDDNLQKFDKDKLLSILIQNGFHSIEQSDSEDETRQKLPNNKRFLHVYDHGWHSEKAYDTEKIRNEATDVEMFEYRVNNNNDKMTQYDDASLTDPNLDYLLNSAEMNLIQPEDLDKISESSQSQKNYEKKGVKREKKDDPEEETIDTIFNVEVVYSDS
ncbi:hypothetical protein C1645_819253 [Glomus cerebriforme]|uniref:Uncharacterized protein n=1 Tax=Glomus cerebriforme TaxID=658196 RepID=A0A397TF48_9GLOM|nr:hypothetical protein C1645_819253 [Glomus cerebriforme]